MTGHFATTDQISRIQTMIAERDWNGAEVSAKSPKYVSRVAVVNMMVGWATGENVHDNFMHLLTAESVGARVNALMAHMRETGDALEGSEYCYTDLTEDGANALISWLQTVPKKTETITRKDQELAAPMTTSAAPSKELEDGMYRNPAGEIFKVYHTQRGFQVAKRLCADGNEDGTSTVWFEYEGKRPLARLNASMRMSYEEMKQFGAVYGSCCVCSKTLTDELSVALGIGPVCGNREFGETFKETVKLTRKELKAASKKAETKEVVQMQLGS